MPADLSLQQALIRILAILLVSGVHGFTLAGAAYLLGDRGPRDDGRLTLNPFAHADLLGLVAGVVSRLAWIRPVAIDAAALRWGRFGLVACVGASLAALLLLGVVVVQLRPLATGIEDPFLARYAILLLTELAECAVWSAAFNLLPLPPLTGWYLAMAVAPSAAAAVGQWRTTFALILAAAIILAGGAWFSPGRSLADMLLR